MNDYSQEVQSKSNEEILKMVYEFDTWSPEMLKAVEKELDNRKILPSDINIRKQKLIEIEDEKLRVGKEASLFGLIIGWLTVFGLLEIFIGYNYTFSKERSKFTNKEYFKYNEISRKNGSYLFYTSITLSLLALAYSLIK